ncbi:MAG: GNAT family N-acetyltransferase [Acidobacteria bacterium]|nr:GNAT family N-acetyltransferase [Acidobacteriota bacterium]
MKPPLRIETARLVLRKPVAEDATAIFEAYAQDELVARYLTWPPHENVEVTERVVAGCIAAWEGGARFPYVIELRETGAVVGMIEMRHDEFRVDVGYVLAREHWGRGLMTEALREIVAWALSQEKIYRVSATCDTENAGSARVLEKAGMQREGILRRRAVHPNMSPEPRDCYCYSAVK